MNTISKGCMTMVVWGGAIGMVSAMAPFMVEGDVPLLAVFGLLVALLGTFLFWGLPEVTKIYASAYDRNADAREFYRFLKTMETYESTFDQEDWLILSSDSDFYKYLKRQSGR